MSTCEHGLNEDECELCAWERAVADDQASDEDWEPDR
jgi:hypothetical protein